MHAVSSKTGRSWSASSSSGDGEDQKLGYESMPSGQRIHSCVSYENKSRGSKAKVKRSEKVKAKEDCKMEVDAEADSRKKLD